MSMNPTFIKNLFAGFVICFVVAAGNVFAQTSYQIVPGVKFGAITARTSEAELKRIYGSKNVKSGDVGLGEGETVPGTIVFDDDPTRRIEIAWKNEKTRKSPDFIQFGGEKSRWRLAPGISAGTSLKIIERLNGKSFTLLGFGWDYEGTIVSWNGGKLARGFGKDSKFVTLRLNAGIAEGKSLQKAYEATLGDGEFSSQNASMQKLNPTVYHIIVKFP
jgi:hypothetical protein